jgi:hypothetical protein
LLAAILRWLLGKRYEVREEVPVGNKPLQLDFLLLLREDEEELGTDSLNMLAGLVDKLNEQTIVEFKSPADALRLGDLQTVLGYLLIYRGQNDPLFDPGKLTLVFVAPAVRACEFNGQTPCLIPENTGDYLVRRLD